MTNPISDVLPAVRSLRRSPGFSATAVLILALGIGTSVAMFTTFHALLIKRLPVTDQDRVVVLWAVGPNGVEAGGNKLILQQIRREARTIANAAGVVHWGAAEFPLVDGDRTIVLNQAIVESSFFEVLGSRPVLGRFFRSGDEAQSRESADQPVVISYQVWRRQFHGDSAIVGHQMLNPYAQSRYTIVGVAPPGLDYPAGVGYWVAFPRDEESNLITIARLRPGVTAKAARDEYFAIAKHVDASWAPDLMVAGARVHTLPDEILGHVRPVLNILTAAVVLLLLIACVNVGNMILLRATIRARELAVRRALGASYGRIVRHLLSENIVLGVTGGALGFACAEVLLRAFLVIAPADLPRLDVLRVTGAPIWLAMGMTVAAVLLFGVAPALMAPRVDIDPALRVADRSGTESRARRRFRELLVASQIALALVMIAGAGLLARSLAQLQRLDLGYKPDHLSFFSIALPEPRYDTLANVFALGDIVLPRLRATPGVTALTPVVMPPFLGSNIFLAPFQLEGATPAANASLPMVALEGGGVEYFRTMGIPIVRGRGFTPPDGAGSPSEAVVSDAAARLFWPGKDAIGQRIRNPFLPDSGWHTVVGIVHDLHYRSLREATPTVFLRWRQYFWQGNIAIRTTGSLGSVLPAIRRALAEVDPHVTVLASETMDDYLAVPLATPRLDSMLMVAFGLVALFLASMGLYGIMAAAVRQRTRELGVRMALGATPSRLRRAVLQRAFAITGVGILVGGVLALSASQLLRAVLFGVKPTDPLTMVGASLILLAVGLGAAYLPAHWATKIDPSHALRVD